MCRLIQKLRGNSRGPYHLNSVQDRKLRKIVKMFANIIRTMEGLFVVFNETSTFMSVKREGMRKFLDIKP